MPGSKDTGAEGRGACRSGARIVRGGWGEAGTNIDACVSRPLVLALAWGILVRTSLIATTMLAWERSPSCLLATLPQRGLAGSCTAGCRCSRCSPSGCN